MPEPYRLFTATDATELTGRIDAARRRFVELLGSVDPTLRLPNSTWTARDVAGHLLNVSQRYTRRDRSSTEGLSDSPRGVDRQNAEELAALGDAPRDELLTRLGTELDVIAAVLGAPGTDLHPRNPFHGGVTIDVAGGLSNLVAELLIHGRDVALAAGRAWSIEERDAVLILNGVLQVIPAYARRSAMGSLRLRLDVPDAVPWMLAFTGGVLDSRPAVAGEPVDAVVRVPASTLVLALYARISTMRSLRDGWRVTGGRRPWRVLRLQGLLQKP